MATLTTVPPHPAAAPRRPWNTLEILSRSRSLLCALLAFLLAAVVFATQTHRHAMTLVGKDTAPSIVKAQEIKTALADMDADAVNDLLDPGDPRAAGQFNTHRVAASKALVEAAKNVTYGEAETVPLDNIEVAMGNYERLVQQARDSKEESAKDTDEKADLARRYYRAASIIMDGTLLPAADALDQANNDQLKNEYLAQSRYSFWARLAVLLLGVAMIAALVWVQLFLSRRMQRTFNPALLAATVIAFCLTFYAFASLAREQSDLREAREDAFSSVRALLQARAVAYSANADESRFLFDPGNAAEYLRAFDQKAASLVHLPAAEQQSMLGAQLRSGEKVPGFTGFLADEYNNITYPGEREAAIDSVTSYEQYLAIDRQLRTLEHDSQQPGQSDAQRDALHQKAIALDVGDQPPDAEGRGEQSDYAFTQFDDALTRTLAINQTEFERAVASGFHAVANLELEAVVVGILLAVLLFLGFAPRIREYQ